MVIMIILLSPKKIYPDILGGTLACVLKMQIMIVFFFLIIDTLILADLRFKDSYSSLSS